MKYWRGVGKWKISVFYFQLYFTLMDYTLLHLANMKMGFHVSERVFPILYADRGEGGGSYKVADEVHSNRESAFEENCPVHPGTGRHTTSQGEEASSLMHDSKSVPGDVSSNNSDMKWSHQPKDFRTQWENNLDYLSDTRDVAKWQSSEDSIVKRQLTGYLDGELETRRVPQTSPEELSLFYKDPRGQVQGPFKGVDIIGWLEAGYFGIDLLVRLESAAADSPWLQLVDVMPHLRAKARPPPGFPVTKLDTTEAPVRQSTGTFVNIHTGLGEVERLRNNSMHRLGSATEAENRFLESLMSGSKSSSPLENVTLSEGNTVFLINIFDIEVCYVLQFLSIICTIYCGSCVLDGHILS